MRQNKFNVYHTLDGIRTRNLWIRSPMRYPLRHKSIMIYVMICEVKWTKTLCIGPTGIWTRISGFRVHCANRYTIGPTVLCVCVWMTTKFIYASTGNRTRTSCLEGTNSNHCKGCQTYIHVFRLIRLLQYLVLKAENVRKMFVGTFYMSTSGCFFDSRQLNSMVSCWQPKEVLLRKCSCRWYFNIFCFLLSKNIVGTVKTAFQSILGHITVRSSSQ